MANSQPFYCSSIDSLFPPVMQNWVVCFPCDTSNVYRASNILRTGFEKTIQQRPYLAGRLCREDVGPRAGLLKLTYPRNEPLTIRFSVNDLTERSDVWAQPYEDLRQNEMPIRHLKPGLLLPSDDYDEMSSRLIMAQANFIPGGCLLGVCLNHSFFDGVGGSTIIGAWARNCRELQSRMDADLSSKLEPSEAMAVGCNDSEDRKTLNPHQVPQVLQGGQMLHGTANEHELAEIRQDLTSWQLLGLQKPPTDPVAAWALPSTKTMISLIFAASAESIKRLKIDSRPSNAQNLGQPSDTFVSSFDAIAALVWRCIMRARYADLDDDRKVCSRLRIPINVRKILDISNDYQGNVLLNCVTELPMEALITAKTGQDIASKIRSSLIFSRDASRVLDALKLATALPEIAARRPLFSDTTSNDLVLTSWQDLPYYKHDWGPIFGSAGNADFFRVPHGLLRGICALQPRRDCDTVEVLINLEQGQMNRLQNDEEFVDYFKPLASTFDLPK